MGTGTVLIIVLSAFVVALIVGRWWIAADPILLAAAWWAFTYMTASFPDGSSARDGALTAALGALLAVSGVLAGLLARRGLKRCMRPPG